MRIIGSLSKILVGVLVVARHVVEVTVWGRADLKDVDDSDLGLKGSPTKIAKASDKVRKGAGEKVTLDPQESVEYIMSKLTEKHVI